MTKTKEFLKCLDACDPALDWIGNRSLYQAWRECPQGDWMLWLAEVAGVDLRLLVRAACACARTALEFDPDGENSTRIAIETAEAWCDGKASLGEVISAAHSAFAADIPAAAFAAYAAVSASGCAAYASTYAAAADADADIATQKHHAKLVRKMIPWRLVRDGLEELR